MKKVVTLLAAVLTVGALNADARAVDAYAWGCQVLDYGYHASAKCTVNDGVDPDRVRVQIICSNDPYRRWLSGPWVPAQTGYVSTKYCANNAPMLNWRYQLGA